VGAIGRRSAGYENDRGEKDWPRMHTNEHESFNWMSADG
jgi:hypothetical protein